MKEVFDAKGETCVIEDALRFISEKTSGFISWGHVFVYRNLPWLFNWGYDYTERHTDIFREKSVVYNFFGKGADELYECIVKGAYDTVICPHPFSALMLTETKRRYGLSVKTAFVATDYTCSPSVKDSALDYYFIPHTALVEEFECKNIPQEKIIASGIPVRQMFYDRTGKDKAKEALGIEPSHKHMVMMCGSMGCGPIKNLAGVLTERLQEGFDLTVICGTNHKLKARLEQKYSYRKNIHIHGFVKDMSSMLDSADLCLTKAGGISITEAAIKKVPMLLIDAVAGNEGYNSTFYAGLGCARKGGRVADLAQICETIVKDENSYQAMVSAFGGALVQNAAVCIYNTLKGKAG